MRGQCVCVILGFMPRVQGVGVPKDDTARWVIEIILPGHFRCNQSQF
jgi:hypothetical protein